MPLPWVRLDTSMPDNPKVVELCERGDVGMAAAFVWTCSLAYSGKHGTDGYIPRAILPRLNGKAKHAQMLVQARLWDADPATGGWLIHGWEEFQESTDETKKRSERARLAALARWSPNGSKK